MASTYTIYKREQTLCTRAIESSWQMVNIAIYSNKCDSLVFTAKLTCFGSWIETLTHLMLRMISRPGFHSSSFHEVPRTLLSRQPWTMKTSSTPSHLPYTHACLSRSQCARTGENPLRYRALVSNGKLWALLTILQPREPQTRRALKLLLGGKSPTRKPKDNY